MTGEGDSPSTDLLAAWLAVYLKVPVKRIKASQGEGIVAVTLERRSGAVELTRPDGKVGTLEQPGQPSRRVALQRRPVRDCLSEELRRLDPDEIYEATLTASGQDQPRAGRPPGPPSRPEARGRRPAQHTQGVGQDGAPAVGEQGVLGQVDQGRFVSTPQIVVYSASELVAPATAARLVTRLVDVQAARGSASVVLTGGRTGIAVLEHLRAAPARDAVDWSRVDLYWGDERFLPAGHPDRNETQARAALLDHVPVDPRRVHAMPASDGVHGDNPDAAAQAYADELSALTYPEDHGSVPSFDVCLLGVGEEGHTASIFPASPAVYETERMVVAVRNCPKPPPTRLSLTLPALRRSAEVWLLTTGASKAAAVAMALGGAGEVQIPAAGVSGRRRTLWLLDRPAAAKVPGLFSAPTS